MAKRPKPNKLDESKFAKPRYIWWEKEYLEHSYMHLLPTEYLTERFIDLLSNTLMTSAEGKVGIQSAPVSLMWYRFLQHVLAEAATRGLPYPKFLNKKFVPNWSKDGFFTSVKNKHSRRAFETVSAWAEETGVRQFSVIKYGKREHMERFLYTGEVLIRPSTTYDDEKLNRAQRDDENSFSIFGSRTSNGMVVPVSDLPNGLGDTYSMTTFVFTSDRDYMLYCMGGTLSATLFSQFGQAYDACVLVRDMKQFVSRMTIGTKDYFPHGDFVHRHCRTTYVDPLGAIPLIPKPNEKVGALPIPFIKHFRYAYQKEYRFVWVPTTPRRNLKEVCVSIGTLEDIAEIITL